MASREFIILLASIAVFFAASATTATKYWVGDKAGWTIDYDYQALAKDKVFRVGDTLFFMYPKGNDSVYKVNRTEFKDCIVPVEGSPGLTTGHDEIRLTTPGMRWYISGAPQHCSDHKQKFAVNVIQAEEATAPSPCTPAAALHMAPSPWIRTPGVATIPPPSAGNSAHGIHDQRSKLLFVAAAATLPVV